MNKKQIVVLWIGIAVIVVMCLFPPWHYKSGDKLIQGQIDWGYKFILTPAQAPNPDYEQLKGIIDVRRLFIQILIVGLITTGLIVTFIDRKKD